MNARMMLLGAAAGMMLGGTALSGAALAGPCSSQIAQLDKTLSQSPALGPVTTGALAGSGPGAIKTNPQPDTQASATGTSAGGKLGGTGGTKEMNAASNQVATSAQDVRRQQEGKPTMAAATSAPASNSVETQPGNAAAPSPDRLSEAKMDVSQARALDAKGDQSCMDPLKRAQALMQGS